MDFLRPGLKTGVGNGIFWSEIGSGFGDMGGTSPPKISTSTPPPGFELTLQFGFSAQHCATFFLMLYPFHDLSCSEFSLPY